MADQRKRGARPSPRHRLAAATPHRITGETPPQFIVIPPRLSMWLNDQEGDCVTAEEAFAKACHSPEVFISDATVQAWAVKNNVQNGAELDQVLTLMRTAGFQQDGVLYNDGPATTVDWTNAAILQNAIAQGPVKLGVAANQLERVVGQKNGWLATGFQRDPNLDHCPSLCGYGPAKLLGQLLGVSIANNFPAYAIFTWGTIGIIDVPSMLAITGEAWLRNPTTVTVGPTPAPIPTPGPTPTPPPAPSNLKQQIDAIFVAAEARFMYFPVIASILRSVQAAVDARLLAAGFRQPHMTSLSIAKGVSLPMPQVMQIIDAAFSGAIAAFPEYAVQLKAVQALVDLYLPMA